MKRLAIFLFGICLLASCEEIEEARTLPKEFSISDITDVSELTYDELENLVTNSNYYDPVSQKEEMRRNGGLIVKGLVSSGNGEAYDHARLWFAAKESDLPTNYSDMWNMESIDPLADNGNNLSFYLSNDRMMNSENALSSTYYYKLGLQLWDTEYPGFLDNCMQDSGQMMFSGVKAYTRPEVPYIFECGIEGEDVISGNFRVRSQYPITKSGICYSATNQLPTLADEVAEYSYDYTDKTDVHISLYATPRKAGTYYVRAFAVSEKGISYSSAWKVSAEGGYVEATVDTMINVSEMKYSELESLIADIDDYSWGEDLRRNGGLILKASVQEYNHSYRYITLWYASNAENMPNGNIDFRGSNQLSPINSDKEHPIFYHNYSELPEFGVFYYELQLAVETSRNSYSIFPWADKKTLDAVPFVHNCNIYSSYASFSMESATAITRSGVCYSASNELPTINDQIVVMPTQDAQPFGYVQFENGVPAAGTYYMRAFATSAEGTGYSPVQKVTIY